MQNCRKMTPFASFMGIQAKEVKIFCHWHMSHNNRTYIYTLRLEFLVVHSTESTILVTEQSQPNDVFIPIAMI